MSPQPQSLCSKLLLMLSCMMLSGCMGAPLAQQLLSSIVVNSADNIIENAQQAQQRDMLRNRVLQDTPPDDYWGSFVTAGFQKIMPIEEVIPPQAHDAQHTYDESRIVAASEGVSPEASPLVRVEVWNMLVGEEKLAVLENAYRLGDEDLPPKSQWSHLRVATGSIEGSKEQVIVFLVPNELGRLASGQKTIVELGSAGDLSIARYAAID